MLKYWPPEKLKDFSTAATVQVEKWVTQPNKPGVYSMLDTVSGKSTKIRIKGTNPNNFHYDVVDKTGQIWAYYVKHLTDDCGLVFYGPLPL
jgi:hypothetical protein